MYFFPFSRSLRVNFLLLLLIVSSPAVFISIGAELVLKKAAERIGEISSELSHEIRPVITVQLRLHELYSRLPGYLSVEGEQKKIELEEMLNKVLEAMDKLDGDHFKDSDERGYFFDARNEWLVVRNEIYRLLRDEGTLEEQQERIDLSMRGIDRAVHLLEFIHDGAIHEVEKHNAETIATRDHFTLIFSLLLSLGLVVFLLAYFYARRLFFGPLQRLHQAADHFAHGTLDYRLQKEDSQEFDDLSRTFNQMADQLEQQHQRLHELAIRDGLTGLINHTEFGNRLYAEWQNSVRKQRNIVLMMLDLDHFKKINDNYGHPTGDLALKCVAEVLKTLVRPVDVAARYGGEEFSVLLPETDIAVAKKVAERILEGVRGTSCKGPRGEDVSVTISIGLASGKASPEQLLHDADVALYRAKDEGRNRVCISADADD